MLSLVRHLPGDGGTGYFSCRAPFQEPRRVRRQSSRHRDHCLRPGARMIAWSFDDPAGQPMEEFRRVRDEIGQAIKTWLAGS